MPKLKPEQLTAHLSRELAPLYIVSGDEHLLVQESADAIRKACLTQGFANRELYHGDGSFDWDVLHYASQSLGLFAEKKFIELRVSSKLSDKGRKALVEYVQQPPADTVLLLVLPKLERNQLSSKWFSSLEQAGQFIQIWPINANQLPRWIEQRAKTLHLKLNSDAVTLLAARVEGNLLAAIQELEKLSLLNIDGVIDAVTLSDAVADSARYDVFALVDCALKGDGVNASKILQGLKSEGTDVMALLWALSREIRILLQLRHELDDGQNLAAIARKFGIWESRLSLIQNALRRLKKNQLQLLLRLAGQTDRAVKGMHPADPWQTCLDLVLILSGTNPWNRDSTRLGLRA
jgi:DNA polymerase-3 subunit delta